MQYTNHIPMKLTARIFKKNRKRSSLEGFVLPFTMLMSVLILFITTGALTLLSKQLYFSKLYKQSQAAYYAADDAITCITTVDDTYLAADGLGIFPSSTAVNPTTYMNDTLTYVNAKRTAANLPLISSLTDIKCAQASVFDPSPTGGNFKVSSTNFVYHYNHPFTGVPLTEDGKTSTSNMRMDLGSGKYRCAKVTVNKTVSYRQIIVQGYAECDNPNGSIERAVVNVTTN